jgi:zinc transport system substrate-binding protein
MRKSILAAIFTVVLSSLGSLAWATAGQGPNVVVSIKPIHALVAGVMQGVAEPRLLISGGGSPHGYVLRPSQARALADADLVIWVGHSLEGFLEKALATLARQARQLELAVVLREQLLPLRGGGSWDAHAEHEEDAEHEADELNPHLWLSPPLAKLIVARTATALSEVDPAHQDRYRRNAQQLQARLDELHRQLTDKLAPVKGVPYIVFHDAYRYFEAAYGLNAVGSITVDAERRPGARRIGEIRAKIKELNARCVFSEPQFEPRLVATIIEGSGARSGVLDPLGAELAAGVESYFQLMNNLADNLLAGLR